MKFKLKYKIEMTLCVDDFPDKRKKDDSYIKGRATVIHGSPEQIKAKINQTIDDFSKNLEEWYYGPEEEKTIK